MKVARKELVALLQKHDIATSKKNKPFSNDKLLELARENIEAMTGDEDDVDPLAATLAAAIEEESTIKITGDDPTVPRKASKEKEAADKEKSSKKKKSKAAAEDDEEEEAPKKKGDKKKKPVEKKASADRDKWGSNTESSAGRINSVFFANKKPLTMDQIVEALDDESVSRSRIRDHLRRLVSDGILIKDDKDRFVVPKKAKEE
jgi:outer membrane biosynthesis protein TonB